MHTGERVLGVDACKRGWVGIAFGGAQIKAYVKKQIGDLVSAAEADGALAAIAIDIPIGLPEKGPRPADLLAREKVGALRSTVFMTPIGKVLDAPSHRDALEVCRRLGEKGVSIQAHGLRGRIRQVEAWLDPERLVVEVHPEVSFAAMNREQPLKASKHTWAGVEERRRILAECGIELPSDLGIAGTQAGADDILDAAAAAWTARRVAGGTAESLPAGAEVVTRCTIWV